VGDKEVEEGKAALRTRAEGDVGAVEIAEFQNRVLQEIKTRQKN